MRPLQIYHGPGRVVESHAFQVPVHQQVQIETSPSHATTVDYVHWAAHADAVLTPRSTAPRTAARLLRRACERLALPRSVLDDAVALLGQLVAAGVEMAHDRVRIDLDADDRGVRMRVTATVYMQAGLLLVHTLPRECTVRRTDAGTELFAEVRVRD